MTSPDDRHFDDAVDWLLNNGAVDFAMQNRFRAISTGLVPSEEVDDYDDNEIRQMLIDAGESA